MTIQPHFDPFFYLSAFSHHDNFVHIGKSHSGENDNKVIHSSQSIHSIHPKQVHWLRPPWVNVTTTMHSHRSMMELLQLHKVYNLGEYEIHRPSAHFGGLNKKNKLSV